jgi:hypothetical protein
VSSSRCPVPTCHHQGVSHAEWPKNNDEYAPPQIGEAIC